MKAKTSTILAILICISTFSSIQLQAQGLGIKEPANVGAFKFNYNRILPLNQLADRFGNFNSVGFGFSYKLKNNIQFEIEGNYIFGNQIKEPGLLSNMATKDGNITDGGGLYSNIAVTQRGGNGFISVGKVFSFKKPNPNSGILLSVGVGSLLHLIHIADQNNQTPQIQGDYNKGYDRLAYGIAFKEGIYYQFFSEKHLWNFVVGVEYMQGLTKAKRPIYYDTEQRETGTRKDNALSFKFSWLIPIYKRAPQEFYYD